MGRTVEVISQGESFQVDAHDRSYQGAIVPAVFKVSGDVTPGAAGQVQLAAAPSVNGAVQALATGYIHTVITGVASPGHQTLTGANVGDKVLSVVDLTNPGDDSTDWETTISVKNQIQRLTGSATDKYLVFVAKQS